MITHLELQVIMAAQGNATVELPVVQGDTVVSVPFCGTCGRIVHHPDCPSKS